MSLLPGLHSYVKKCLPARSDENIIVEGEKSIKAARKDPSATIVTSIRSTGAAVVGRVNATEFLHRRIQPLIFTTAQSQNRSCNSTVIYSLP